MRSIWSCSSCALLLLVALLGRETLASHPGKLWRKSVHQIAKAQVTAHPARRDEGTCPTEHTSCPASLNGGCCPSRYACAVDSCYATTAGPTTACERANYFACAPVNGGVGCCPVGYVCGDGEECIPPASATYTDLSCPNEYFLCPSSVGYGCCRSGMGCAPNACYSTAPVTTTVLQTITTTSGSQTVTTTRTAVTVATPTPPSGLPTDDANVAAKFIPTSVPKVAASSSSESGGGLSGGAIGGIIAGVVILLIVVVVAAFLIIRRLKQVEDIVESKRGSSKTKSQSQAQMEHYGRQLHSDADDMISVDPLMVRNNASSAGTPQPEPDASWGRSDSTGFTPSPNMFGFADDRSRHASPDSNQGYFDIPGRVQNLPSGGAVSQQPMQPALVRGSMDSAGTTTRHRPYAYTHWRQQSNASELSADGSDNGMNATVHSPLVGGAGVSELEAPGGFAELPGAVAGVRSRSSSTTSAPGRGHGYVHARSRSGGINQPPPGQSSPTVGASGLEPLATLVETASEMHGYHGPRNQQAGQTAAGLDAQSGWDVSGGFYPQQQQQEPRPGAGL
ncbi:hypothetical protein C8A03DRAFT_11631 [Achaetomium macrosporum]|uniref:Uncharacterized protein n=1 Tax=Achaetomium macrosporum TaxID=79813 RepID=A0AAN7CHD9_9PEZI|nr:hypothetical protein C8A03DRAFT_11631 [Achaetomium macrosporum]